MHGMDFSRGTAVYTHWEEQGGQDEEGRID